MNLTKPLRGLLFWAIMAKSIPLKTDTWDIFLDSAGNLSLTDNDSSIAQDVASSVRTFEGECWYNTTLGMPYFQAIFGKSPPNSFVVASIKEQAFTVDAVNSVNVVNAGLQGRNFKGVIVVNAPQSPITVTI